MRTMQFVDEGLVFKLYGTGPAAPEWCGYLGNMLTRSLAAQVVQAVNTYDERQALLEQVQATLALIDVASSLKLPAGLHRELVNLQKQVNAAVLQHHEWLEQQS